MITTKRFGIYVFLFAMAMAASLFTPNTARSATGDFLFSWGHDYDFYDPTGVAVDSSDNVYVVDSNGSFVQVFDPSGNLLRKWGGWGTGDGEFWSPQSVALDSSGNVYVADYYNNRVQKFDNNGTFITKWGGDGPGYNGSGTGDGQFQRPVGIAVDSSNNVYVADYINNRVQKFDSNGEYITKFGGTGPGPNGRGSGDGQFYYPMGIAVDSGGNVYVVDSNNNRVQKFDSNGKYLTKWGGTGPGWNGRGSGDGEFSSPRGIAVDSGGKVFVSDTGNNRVQVFDSNGMFMDKFGSYGTGDGEFQFISGIAVDSGGNAYVVDLRGNKVQIFDSSGQHLAKWSNRVDGDGYLYYPEGVAVGPGDNVYVVDTMNHMVQVFDSAGNFLRKWGSYGSGEGQFIYPKVIDLDSSGDVYVADGRRMQVFDSAGNYKTKIAMPGRYSTGFAMSHDGYIYLGDSAFVSVYDQTGALMVSWGGNGTGDGQFRVGGLTLGPNGDVYVIDTYNQRIQVFDAGGNFLRKWGSRGTGDGQFEFNGMRRRHGIAVDKDGNVYVGDSRNFRVQIFDANGTFLDKWGSGGYGDGEFWEAYGLAVNSNNTVYLVDASTHRVQAFEGVVVDADGDGYASDVDCNDDDPAVNPGADEVCDSIDNNCDGAIDEGVKTTFYSDADADTYGDVNATTEACMVPGGYVTNSADLCVAENSIGFDVNEDGCIDSASGMVETVDALLTTGAIDTTLASSVTQKLSNAVSSADRDNVCAAINQLTAFIKQVNGQRGKKVSEEAVNEIIAYAESVIAALTNDLPEGDSC